MGIFSRMTDIINSNLNALMDKAEDPQKMIRLIIQEMEETLIEVRSSSARVIADRKTAARKAERLMKESREWESKAELAIEKGREDLARAALAEKRQAEDDSEALSAELSHLDEELEKLDSEIGQLQARLTEAKAKQKAISMRHSSMNNRMKVKRQVQREALDAAFNRFETYERKMDHLEGQLDSMDLGIDSKMDLRSEFEALEKDDSINAELERLKKKVAPKEK